MIDAPKLRKNVLWALIIFGLFGQIAWTIENMYFNVFLYKTIDSSQSGIDAIAVMVAASAITATLTTLIMGALSDKLGKRKVFVVAGYLIWGVIIMSFAFVSKANTAKLFPGAEVVGATVAIVVALDCLMTFFGSTANDASFNAWVTDVTVPENRGKAEGILSALPLLALLIVFGGFDGLTQGVNPRWDLFFYIIGGMVILGGIAGLFIIKDNCVAHESNANYFKNIIYGFRPSVIKNNKPLYIILIAMGIFCTAQQVFMPYLIIYIEYYLGIKNYAIVLAIVLILAAVISVLMGKQVDKYGKHKFLYLSAAIFTVGLFIMYLHGKFMKSNMTVNMIFLTIFGTIMMGGSLLLSLIINAGARDYMPEEQRGHYNGIRMIFFVLIPMVVGPAIGAKIISRSDATYIDPTYQTVQTVPNAELFLWAGIISIIVFIPLLFIVRHMKSKLPNEKLYTRWGKEMDKNNTLPEYPRPQMVRDSYINLNGVWQYAIYNKQAAFEGYQGDIVVPYSPESLLSGVNKIVTPEDKLYYQRSFSVPDGFIKGKTLLHFGAVDYECKVSINGQAVGGHKGGFTPFTLDITSAVKAGDNEITLEVTDPTDTSWISRGKQATKSGGIWYTPQSGIWQTVWMESVPDTYIANVKLLPDIDKGIIKINPVIEGKTANITAKITLKGATVAEAELKANSDNEIAIKDVQLWTPEEPNLYDVEIIAGKDKITSYFGMRKY
jgi:MFS family permease